MGLVTLPNSLTAGTLAVGEQVRANDDAVVAQVNGNLTDVNINTGAAISGSKLSNVAGSRVPSDRIEDDAVTFDKLRDSATINGDRAVGVNHLRDDSVIARTVKMSSTGFTPGGSLGVGAATSFDTGILASQIKPTVLIKSFAGVPATPQMSLVLSLWRDTNLGKYHICVFNPSGAAVSLVGMTFLLFYHPVS